jgi:RNA recognition motif-containing protein
MNIFVANLNFKLQEDELLDLFENFALSIAKLVALKALDSLKWITMTKQIQQSLTLTDKKSTVAKWL